jgi:hypothetical protein
MVDRTQRLTTKVKHGRIRTLSLVLLPLATYSFTPKAFTTLPSLSHLKPYRNDESEKPLSRFGQLFMSSEVNDDKRTNDKELDKTRGPNVVSKLWQTIQEEMELWKKLPPFNVEDTSLLFYDVFLIVNLALSISFWVTHRMDLAFLPSALSEGSLMSLLWIFAGLYNGAFLFSAKDGHFGSTDERGGPKAAALLGFLTFLNAINLRLVVAFAMALAQHRPVGSTAGEQIMVLEMGFGLVLMSVFRYIHSSMVPRI